ncbi:MAG: hypothetical protein L0Z54_00745, partial [Thermoplasmata archaeon]|nr:hypothetical protein [Thermoplasmata archaeon]
DFDLTMPFPEGLVTYSLVVNDTIMESSREFVIDVIIVINSPPRLKDLAHYIPVNDPQQVRFSVHYIDPDGDPPKSIILVLETVPEQRHVMTSSAHGADAFYSTSALIINAPGTYHYYVEASDGRDITESEPGTLVIDTIAGTEQPPDEEAGTLEPLLAIFGNTFYLVMIVLAIVLTGAIAGVASRRTTPQGPAAGAAPLPQPIPPRPTGPTWPMAAGPAVPGGRPGSDVIEVEFLPAQVDSYADRPRPESTDTEWRPRGRPSAGPFVPSRWTEDEDEARFARSEDQWDRLLGSDDFEEESVRNVPRRPSWDAIPRERGGDEWGAVRSDGASGDGWGTDDGWASDDGWARDDAPSGGAGGDANGGAEWGEGPTGDDPFGGGDWAGDATVREFSTRKKPATGFGMFDDVDEVDVSDWDDR